MALIICKSCGKRVSDTAEKCIHCGASLAEELIEEVKEEEIAKEEVNKVEKEEEGPKLIDFAYYNTDDQLELQKEFNKSDKWARKYCQREMESHAFLRTFFWPYLMIWGLYIIMFRMELDFSYTLLSHLEEPIGMIAWQGLMVLTLVMLIPFSIIKIYHKSTSAKYVYMKKFQKWLKENKGIEYTPPLIKIKQKEKFDSIVID